MVSQDCGITLKIYATNLRNLFLEKLLKELNLQIKCKCAPNLNFKGESRLLEKVLHFDFSTFSLSKNVVHLEYFA